MKYKVAVLTSTRAEYGLLKNLCQLIESDKSLQLKIVVTGTHLEKEYGFTYDQIKKDGFKNLELINLSIKKNISLGEIAANLIKKISIFFDSFKPDYFIVLGDRYEALGAVYAAFIKKISIFHLHGGEQTIGSLDQGFRNAISQLADFHFTSLEIHTKNLINMGINKKRIITSGPMILDVLNSHNSCSKDEFEKILGFKFGTFNILLTFHPESYSKDYGVEKLKNILKAILYLESNVLITYPNIDEGSENIKKTLISFTEQYSKKSFLYRSIGSNLYLSSLKLFDVVVGNSSSGIIEAPLIGIPSLNVGERQKGRAAFGEVFNTDGSYDAIIEKLEKLKNKNENDKVPRTLQIPRKLPSYEIIKRLKKI